MKKINIVLALSAILITGIFANVVVQEARHYERRAFLPT